MSRQAAHVVVVGAGIAGMAAALGLARQGLPVVLVDGATALGGACRGVRVERPGFDPVSVDVGVSDFNRATFRRLAALMGELALPLTPVCQEASFSTPQGQWLWSSSPSAIELAPGLDASFTAEIARFKAEAPAVTDPALPAGEWLQQRGFAAAFCRLYFAPRASGCFPSPDADPASIPIRALARFWGRHGLVGPGPADRVCVKGGMHRYLPALRARLLALGVQLRLGEPVLRIERAPLRVHTAAGMLEADRLVLAVPPAQALRVLARPTPAERAVLSACRTQPGRVVLHGDVRLMPSDPARWAAYNYVVPGAGPGAGVTPGPTITFYPQKLARLPGRLPRLFVTLNPRLEPRDVVTEHTLAHPVFGRDDAVAPALARLQGAARTWYCGAWTAEPYLHEQGLASGLDVAGHIAREAWALAA
jgi:predicted NAD/FAD-binding protein